MSVSDKIFQLYQRFYAQKGVLTEAPALTINPDSIGVAEFPLEKAMDEISGVASYLMSIPPRKVVSNAEQIRIVRDNYQNQPFWQQLLFDYLSLKLDLEEARLKQEGKELYDKLTLLSFQIKSKENEADDIIAHFAQKIEAEHFHVDASSLLRNYFKMAKRSKDEAWGMLTTNPAYFSPIITRDEMGKEILSPDQAINENKRLAGFLKGLKG